MDRLLQLIPIALVSFALMTGCDDKNGGPDFMGGTITAKIDTNNWSSTSARFTRNSNSTSIVADNADGTSITIQFVGTTTGTYTLDGTGGNSATYTDGAAAFFSSSGSITITEYTSDQISGTFSFNGIEPLMQTPVSVTNGTITDAVKVN